MFNKQENLGVHTDGKAQKLVKERDKRNIDGLMKALAGLEAAKMRTICDQEALKVYNRKHRATDAKHNTRMLLPGPRSRSW